MFSRTTRRVGDRAPQSHRFLSAAIGAAAVEINQNFARLGAFARTDDAAAFQFVHDARGAAVAEPQTPLHERHARLLFAADDLDALLDEVLVLVNAAFVAETGGGLGKLLVNFQVVVWLALLGDELDDAVDFLVGDERALRANQLAEPGGRYSMSPLPSNLSAPIASRIVRESTCAAHWNAMRAGMFALMTPVMTSTLGRWVATMQ